MKIIKNKKVGITLLVLLVVLVMLIFITDKINKENNKKIELATSIYEKIHNLYYYGGNIEYEKEDDPTRTFSAVGRGAAVTSKLSEDFTDQGGILYVNTTVT